MNRELSIHRATAYITEDASTALRRDSAGSASRGLPVLRLILALPLLAAAFVDLPARLRVGPMSGGGALTITLAAFAAAGVLLCGSYPKRLLVRVLPYFGFLVWIGLSLTWARPGFWGIQNGILYVLFGLLVLLSGVVSANHPCKVQQLISWCMRWIDYIALPLVLLNVLLRGLPTGAGLWLTGPRSIALLGLIPLSWHLAGWYHRDKGSFVPACLWLAAIAVSLSRAAMAIALVLVGVTCFCQFRFRLRRAARGLAFFATSLTIAGALVTYSTAFQERLFGGDAALQVGSARINTEGRLEIWNVVVASAEESPIIGRGIGSSQVLLAAAYPRFPIIDHPHNDYLRLWHDLGIMGLLLFSAAIGIWLAILLRSWRRAESCGHRSAQVALAGAMGLLSMLLAMVTDNVIVYAFVMGPLGVLVGAGLGVRVQGSRFTTP